MPSEWYGIPLPPHATVVHEDEQPIFGWGPELELAVDDPESLNLVHFFYQERLRGSWQLCPFAGSEWKNLPSLEVGPDWRIQVWFDAERQQHVSVVTVGEGEHTRGPAILLTFYDKPSTWPLVHRGLCQSSAQNLFHPLALQQARRHCYDDSGMIFEPDIWKASGPDDRGQMLSDLICRGMLLGLSREQTLALLGTPDGDSESGVSFRVRKPGGFGKYKAPVATNCTQGWFDLRFHFPCDVADDCRVPYTIDEICEPDA